MAERQKKQRNRSHDLPPPAILDLYSKHFPNNKNKLLDYLAKEHDLEARREKRYLIRDISSIVALFSCLLLAAVFLNDGKPLGLAFLAIPVMGVIKTIVSPK
ncbi:hypothetical protein [Acidithiobacillus sulfuriphilus]|uniref:hypothetical protein n=1 Tax=Acidithiobacillus sulfuriphilus TaxID=1867749 RepID=UPI003F61A074